MGNTKTSESDLKRLILDTLSDFNRVKYESTVIILSENIIKKR